ncbi:class I SAM-dependent RNA methyltransferase [Maritimibacter sp. DP1N21-5]|uniref:THUMP domain-containing class I SAM-dependent RNA methyltransferase n=1 Tax=Maritimibacter sp. DP1N21-5 TaxID=2836867 RepID=UPI001C444E4C|nr:class I SAM-dependent RNA methyltransferase [Maritimibacter sp. DP1N21-5]MBV7407970.1 class I SAM-dependent RNA methyltransferase [Maritimibacter sp. DP1N21-5]
MQELDIFAVCPPGLEPQLAAECRALGFTRGKPEAGGVTLRGGWSEVWRANLELRGATRVLVRLGSFPAFHLAQLDKRARGFDWSVLQPHIPVRVDVTTNKKSKIYHAGAAAERIERAIREERGAPIEAEAPVRIMARIDRDLVTISIDSSGESLHKRGHKRHTGKAPIRETLAALLLRACDYQPGEAVVDPMCGSGTFLLEAAEWASDLQPGRDRDFAFEHLTSFDPDAFASLRRDGSAPGVAAVFYGSDRDRGAVDGALRNAESAGVDGLCHFTCQPLAALEPPPTPPGLVILNPPYGERIGAEKSGKGPLYALYGSFGKIMTERFPGWRVGLVTSDPNLAHVTGLDLSSGPVIDNGGIKVKLYQAVIPRGS